MIREAKTRTRQYKQLALNVAVGHEKCQGMEIFPEQTGKYNQEGMNLKIILDIDSTHVHGHEWRKH